MKILIIGGTRFFGKRFVHMMLDLGHNVTILTRGQRPDDFGNKVIRLKADRTDIHQLERVTKTDYDVVVDNMLMNADEANSIISILQNRIGHYVMTSTLSVYDLKSGAQVESDFQATDYIATSTETYQQGKRSAEHALTKAPFAVSIMRIPVIVGSDDWTERLLTHVKAVKENKKLFFPNRDARFSYLHAQDAARALSWFCTERHVGVFNISAPDAWTLKELMAKIETTLGTKFNFGVEGDEASPFNITQDYYMDVSKAQFAGFKVHRLNDWMPNLIEELASNHKQWEYQ